MPKNIVLCSDGTGNSTIKNRGTNVYKLYEAVDLETPPGARPQVAFYDDGVGTGSLKVIRILGGAFGFGFARNVRDLYMRLCRVYRPNDAIYLFGFSRGAYTVRALAGMIATCGVLDNATLSERDLRSAVGEAYRVYRLRYRPERRQAEATRRAEEFRRRRRVYQPGDPVRIAFIGVWDTVGAVGLPDDAWLKKVLWMLSGFRIPWFKHYRLGDIVARACHALAIDDERQTFHPVLWEERRASGDRDPRLEQVWFAGVHSNVGGGYVKQGMSLVALDWMMQQARAADLRFSQIDEHAYFVHQNVYDKLYDSRSGLGTFYRYRPRDLAAISRKFGIDHPRVHASAFDRIGLRTEGYAPGNIPLGSIVVGPDRERLAKVQAAVNTTLNAGLPLDSVRKLVKVRRGGYFVTLFSTIGAAAWTLWSGWATQGLAATASAVVSVSGIVGLLWDLATAHPFGFAVLLVLAAGGWLAAWAARRRMGDRFANVWLPGLPDLRPAAST
jgi:uncharacterized protein (DUF2235 family)